MKNFLPGVLLLLCGMVHAQQFQDYFEDKTLRLDYIFAGDVHNQHAFLSEMVRLDHWYGRTSRLSEIPIQGNGQIKVYDRQSGKLIYMLPFGSLFQEWLTLDEAKNNSKSFENSFLIPYPKKEAKVEISFFDKERKEHIILSHIVRPDDILIRQSSAIAPDFEIVHKAKIARPVRIALVAEGFKEEEMDVFMDFARKTAQNLFLHDVFKRYEDSFEIVAVKVPSTDTDVSVPSKNIWRNTAVKSHFDTFYSERYLTTSHVKLLHSLLETIPYQHIIILANTNVYGGGGILNSYSLTTTKNKEFAPVVVHEFGHSFAGLADEYFYEQDDFENKAVLKVEPWEKNITSLADFKSKWQNLVDASAPVPTPVSLKETVSIGAFEGLKGNGLFIPTLTCRMKINNTKDFCKVCSNAIEEMILFYTKNPE